MHWKSTYQHPESLAFVIERQTMRDILNQEDVVGFYLYVYDAAGNEIYDYLQDEWDIAQEQAWEEFGVPMDSWVEA